MAHTGVRARQTREVLSHPGANGRHAQNDVAHQNHGECKFIPYQKIGIHIGKYIPTQHCVDSVVWKISV